MQRIETGLPGVYELRPKVFRDTRGFFMETYHRAQFAELGITDPTMFESAAGAAAGNDSRLISVVWQP
jgi:dTDP-4-dehydrorhamnose 3,5-epimerase